MAQTTEEELADVKTAVDTILKALNGGNRKKIADVIADAVMHEHRTIQQSFWSAILMAQIEYSTATFDKRNEGSVQFANKVKALAIADNADMGFLYV